MYNKTKIVYFDGDITDFSPTCLFEERQGVVHLKDTILWPESQNHTQEFIIIQS